MSEITASMVRELREKAGAGMMECKKALQATGGDMEAAFDELRKSGLKTAAKKAGRSTGEGRLCATISDDGHKGAMVALACETDFVAKTPDFDAFLNGLCEHVAQCAPADVESCLEQEWSGGGSVGEALTALIGKLGENILIDSVQAFENSEGQVAAYVHHDQKKGAIVNVATSAAPAEASDALKDLCMHIVVFSPEALNRDEVDGELVERERAIIKEGLAGKPEEIQEKIMAGQLEKFFAQRVITEQPWIKDDKMSVGKALDSTLGSACLAGFKRFQVGA